MRCGEVRCLMICFQLLKKWKSTMPMHSCGKFFIVWNGSVLQP